MRTMSSMSVRSAVARAVVTGAAVCAALLVPLAGPASAAVTTPAISAPADVVVGEAAGHVDLVVSLSAPGTSAVTVNYTTVNSTAVGGAGCNAT